MSLEDLTASVQDGRIDTVITAFPDHYGRLVGKRYDAEHFIHEVAAHGTHACNYLLTVDMEMEPVSGYRFANWEAGIWNTINVPIDDANWTGTQTDLDNVFADVDYITIRMEFIYLGDTGVCGNSEYLRYVYTAVK